MAVGNRDGFFGGAVIAGFAGRAARDGRPTEERSLGRYFGKLSETERSHRVWQRVVPMRRNPHPNHSLRPG